ncbi:MAG: multidrug effflux MFS transporter [Azospira sp.]|jgi:DHA1 family bicyclomycin/chloramphenicol resistance-like MFS transporter|nr:multidrug effflux MFS transporter [Azospira sp.]
MILSDRQLALLLAALAALGPFSIDAYLPSFPEIGASLSASPIEVQQTLSVYLIPFAVMALWHGAIADALGRRRVILWALALFCVASLGCAFATRIEHLWLLRAVQGICAGAGVVVGRAIVRDIHDGAAAQKLMAHVTITFALAPAIAPVIGGWLHSWFGWRAVFVFLALLAGALLLLTWRWLPETLPPEKRRSLHPAYLGRTYWKVLTQPDFLAVTAALSLNFCGFFIYVLSAPVFLMTHLGVSERAFLWLFGPAMAGLMLGSWLSGRLAGKLTPLQCIGRGYAVMALAIVFNLAISHALPPGVPWSVLPLFVYTTGMALAMPALTLLALDPFASERGLAASCQTFLQAGTNGLAAGLVAPLLWSSTATLAWGMAGFALLGAAASVLYRMRQRRASSGA